MEGHAGDWTFHFQRLGFDLLGLEGSSATTVGLVLVIGALLIGFTSRRSLDRLASWWVLAFFAAFTISATKMVNYCTPVLPAILFLWVCLMVRLATALPRIHVPRAVAAVVLAVAVLTVAWPLASRSRAIVDRAGREGAANRLSRHYQYRDLRRKMRGLRTTEPARAVLWNGVEGADSVRDRSYVQASFYSGKTAIPFRLDEDGLRWSRDNGVKVYIMVRARTRDRKLQEQEWADHLDEIEFVEIRRRGRGPGSSSR
jgi:hypothetical protein